MIDIQSLCGYGVRCQQTGRFLDAETRQVVAGIHKHWDENPHLYTGMSRRLFIAADASAGLIRRALWDGARKVLGQDIPEYPQAVGDCVSFGAKHAGQYCQIQAMLAGVRAKFETLFPPYLWGMGRLASDCGNNQLGRQDGSMGAWQAKAVTEYGLLPEDAALANGQTLPKYSGAVARAWGNRPGPSSDWIALAKKHLIMGVALVKTWDDVCKAVLNGNPVTVASNVGYTMLPQSDGFHHQQGSWGHQMMIEMVDLGDSTIEAHAGIENNWGDCHGQVVDFRTKDNWPTGRLRARRKDIEDMLSYEDSFAWTGVDTWSAPDVAPDFQPF